MDRDAYKAVHTHYRGFLSKEVRTAGVRVRPETVPLAGRGRGPRAGVPVRSGGGGALALPDDFLAGVAEYQQVGYRVEIVALAVP